MDAENNAPSRKKIERPMRSLVVSAGSAKSSTNTMTTKIAEGAELPAEIGGGALLDRCRDLLHLGRALAGGEHAGPQHKGDDERDQRRRPPLR